MYLKVEGEKGDNSAVSMTEQKDGTNSVHPGGERKLSIPYSVQRRKYGSLDTHSRAVVIAVDPSERAKQAFLCTLSNITCFVNFLLCSPQI